MGRYTGMALHAVVHSSRLGKDINSMPLYALTLACGHVEERAISSFVPRRSRCHQCDTPTAMPVRKQRRPSGTEAPLCVGCRRHRVRRRWGTTPPKRGWRMVGGVAWGWYCSEICAARAMGRTNRGKTGSDGSKVSRANATARALERLTAACRAVMDTDGRVPVKLLVKVFMDERRAWYGTGYTSGYLRARRRIIDRKAV